MNPVTNMRDGEYRLLVLAVDEARAVYAVALSEAGKPKDFILDELKAHGYLLAAQSALEKHVEKHGLPKVNDRV